MADLSVSYQLWLQQCAQKKSRALQQLYEHEAPRLHALAQSLLQRSADAENLVRETFVLIWRNANNYDPKLGSGQAWIYSILRFKAQQHLKHSPTLSPFVKARGQFVIPASASTGLLSFQAIDEKSRKMLALAYLHAYSYAEIAKECQSSIDLTQKQIHLVLLKLIEKETHWKSESTDQLALLGAYCLGLLRDPQQLQLAHDLLGQSPVAAQDLLLWEGLFSALVETLTTQPASESLLRRIFHELQLPLPNAVSTPKTQAAVSAPAPTPKPTPRAPTSAATTTNTAAQPKPQSQMATPIPKAPSTKPLVAEAKIDSHTISPNTEPLKPAQAANSIEPTDSDLSPKQPSKNQSHSKKALLWALLLAGVICIAIAIWAFSPKAPVIQMIQMSPQAGAILQAPGQSSTPGWIVSIDSAGHVLFSPQVRTEMALDQSVQLWTQSPNSTEVRSLGLINPNQPITVPAEVIGEVNINQIFEMTLESKQGATQPTGPVLFIGRVVKFGEFQASQEHNT